MDRNSTIASRYHSIKCDLSAFSINRLGRVCDSQVPKAIHQNNNETSVQVDVPGIKGLVKRIIFGTYS